jgi:uncharacterized protein with HEPN domain
MTEKAKKYLSDILRSIDLVTEFTADTQTFEDYTTDLKTQSAVERQLGIIGEAVAGLRKIAPADELSSSAEIIGFRNRLIHSYDGIDPAIVWAVVINHLPNLRKEVVTGLGDDDDPLDTE